MLSNYFTNPKARAASTKDLSRDEGEQWIARAEARLAESPVAYKWNALIGGMVIELRTNNWHLYEFWVENWFPGPAKVRPHGRLYAVTGIPGEPPHARYVPSLHTAVFVNTDYYGQCKSWALGIAADLLEERHGVHSIHGGCTVVNGKGVVIIAPTGTGKSTHCYNLLDVPGAKLHSDDWLYVDWEGGEATARISERKFYLRTDMAKNFPYVKPLLDRCLCENVENNDYAAFGNSRAILDPTWIRGRGAIAAKAPVGAVILLRRDKTSPAEVRLDADEAVKVLEEGRTTAQMGSGGKPGEMIQEAFYNPYLLVLRREVQRRSFRRMLEGIPFAFLNTGVETVQQSQARIRKIIGVK
ncbi:MAG: hypothetical protein QXO51_08435 [Halobacteria archaeon]